MKTDNNNESFSRADFLNLESFYDDTKYEWYAAKHRKPSLAELNLVRTAFQSNAVLTAEGNISKNQVTTAMEQEDIGAWNAEECSPRLLELCLIHTRFPYPNGLNT